MNRSPPRRVVLPAGALETAQPGLFSLPETVAHHLARVLRLTVGTAVELTDGSGREAQGILHTLGRGVAEVRLTEVSVAPPPPPPALHLLQGVGKGEKLDTVVRQAAELGVTSVRPVLSARSVATRAHKGERLRGIADDALRVSRRAHRTEVVAPRPLAEVLSIPAERKLAFVVGATVSVRDALRGPPPASLAVLVGPEGGFTPDEVGRIAEMGFDPVHIGPHVLRTETAGPAVVAIVRFAYGFV